MSLNNNPFSGGPSVPDLPDKMLVAFLIDNLVGDIDHILHRPGMRVRHPPSRNVKRSLKFNTNRIHAGIKGNLAKTSDSGSSWIEKSISENNFVSDIAVDTNGAIVFAASSGMNGGGGAIYKSQDSGASLIQAYSNTDFGFNTVVIDPNDPSRIYAGGGNATGLKVLGNLYQSDNTGDTWSITGLTDVIVNTLLIDPDDSSVIYAGCGYKNGTDIPLFKTGDYGANWVRAYQGIPGEPNYYAILGENGNNISLLGQQDMTLVLNSTDMSIFHFDGNTWETIRKYVKYKSNDMFSFSEKIYIVGNSGSIYSDNNIFDFLLLMTNPQAEKEDLNSVWGSETGGLYAVGNRGTILKYSGVEWEIITSGCSTDLFGIWGSAIENDVYAVGSLGKILHLENGEWTNMPNGVKKRLEDVWGTNDGANIYAVGNSWWDEEAGSFRFTIIHYDKTAGYWSKMETPVTRCKKLRAIWGSSNTDIYAVGDNGVILHYDGSSWSQIEIPGDLEMRLYDVWGSSLDNVYAVGQYGTIIHYNGIEWSINPPAEGINYGANSVIDLKFKISNTGTQDDPQVERSVYAATRQQGLFASPNQGENWLRIALPDNPVRSFATGNGLNFQIILGSYASLEGSTGMPWMYGHAYDMANGSDFPVGDVKITTASGGKTFSHPDTGIYSLWLQPGDYTVSTLLAGYIPESTATNEVHLSGDNATRVDMAMERMVICLCDMNIDGTVDNHDLSFFAGIFGTVKGDGNYNAAMDVDDNDVIDGNDLNIISQELGRSDCPF